MKLFLALVAMIGLTSCTTTQEAWYHDSKGLADLRKDKVDCEVKAGQAGFQPIIGAEFVNTPRRTQFLRECMRSLGWSREWVTRKRSTAAIMGQQ